MPASCHFCTATLTPPGQRGKDHSSQVRACWCRNPQATTHMHVLRLTMPHCCLSLPTTLQHIHYLYISKQQCSPESL